MNNQVEEEIRRMRELELTLFAQNEKSRKLNRLSVGDVLVELWPLWLWLFALVLAFRLIPI